MADTKVVIVHLRRPGKNDRRDDPFWEFGSFGITHCHAKNLMNPKKVNELMGVRLAFAQGGRQGTRLVFITPPIRKTIPFRDSSEVLWNPHFMPFRYEAAPLLISKDGKTDFPLLRKYIKTTARTTWAGKFSSRFRTRRRPLEPAEAQELTKTYENHREATGRSAIARNYVDALPASLPPLSRAEREVAYEKCREGAGKPPTRTTSACARKVGTC